MKEIQLTKGRFAIVDDEDFAELAKFKWFCYKQHNVWYAARHTGKTTIKMHHQIIGKPGPGLVTDHKDRNGLNNCRNNIHHTTDSKNKFNHSLYSNNVSGYTGISYVRKRRKWKVAGKNNKFLGYFESIDDALRELRSH